MIQNLQKNKERGGMDSKAVQSAYRRYAGVYDLTFGPFFHAGRKLTVRSLNLKPGDRVLEVGVGTGISLSLYPHDVKVVGIDLSRDMIRIAEERVRNEGLAQVEAVRVMDAQEMDFPDASFDKVVAMHVVSVAPDPVRLVAEMRRVCKPGGDLAIVNHFQMTNPFGRAIENRLSALAKPLGFRCNLRLDDFLRSTGLIAEELRRTNPLGHSVFLRCRNLSPAA